jgi:two-component system response regulator MprA
MSENANQQPCEVLVVEDNRDIREALEDVLTDASFAVTMVDGGRAALETLRARGGRKPCVILLDLMMPDMDGAEFRAIQAADPALNGIPVIIVSAHREHDRLARALGVTSYLRKPVDVDDLLATLGQFCSPPTHLH